MKLRRAPQRRRGEPRRANVTRELVERRASEVARRAFAFVDETDVIQRLSLVELGHLAAGWAAALRERGTEPGDRVVVLADERPEWFGALFGVLKLGAVAVPCPPSLLPGELAEIVRIAAARTLVASRDAEKIVATTEAAPPALWLEEVAPADSRAAAALGTFDTSMDDVALLLPVRGPDGSACLAAHTHDSCLRGAARGRHWLGSGRRDRLWCTAEVGTPEFVTTVLGAWAQGTEVVLQQPRDEPVKRLEALELLRVTILVQSAGEFRSLASYRGKTVHDLSGIREAISLGEPASAAAQATFRDRYEIWIRTCYGRPESGVVAADPRGADAAHAGSVGVPLPGSRVGVIDEDGAEVEPGDAGDLAIGEGAPGLFVGYWDDREATESAFRGNWFLTGDRAVREAGDVVRLAFPAEVRALDDRRRASGEARRRLEAEELRRQKELEAQEARLRDEEVARRDEERRRHEEERKQRAEERARKDEARAEERRRLEQEKRQVVELKVAAERRRQTELAARRRQEREARVADKEARDRARAADRVVLEARTREEQEQKRQAVEQERGRTTKDEKERQEARRAEEERKRQAALEREQARTRAEAEKRAREEARRAAEAERRRAEEERKRQAALERDQARTRAEAEKRAREEARRAAEAERRRAEEERNRQQELERALAREKAKRSGKAAPDKDEDTSVVSRIGAYGISPKDRRLPPSDGGPDKAA